MYEMIRQQMAKAVPFAAHVGVEITEIGGGVATAVLDQRSETSNHIGTLHAGALYTLGETASGAAMTGAFAAYLSKVRPLAVEAKVSYQRIARGRIEARAQTAEPLADIMARFDADGRARFTIEVSLADSSGAMVASMSVDWVVSRRS